MTEISSKGRLRERLWGAVVLIAIAVIVLPLLLDGAGSESQFRRVEQLREAPPVPEPPLAARSPAPRLSRAEPEETQVPEKPDDTAPQALTAWVVQAAAFEAEKDALAVRDQLRAAGFASFVSDRIDAGDPFRVLVGPMIRQQSAEQARKNVAVLLQNDPFLMSYP